MRTRPEGCTVIRINFVRKIFVLEIFVLQCFRSYQMRTIYSLYIMLLVNNFYVKIFAILR